MYKFTQNIEGKL